MEEKTWGQEGEQAGREAGTQKCTQAGVPGLWTAGLIFEDAGVCMHAYVLVSSACVSDADVHLHANVHAPCLLRMLSQQCTQLCRV